MDLATPEQILAHLTECAQNHTGESVVGISAPYASAMAQNAELREAFLKADLLIPDGKGFVWGARLLGVPCGDRLAIPDLCERLLEIGAARVWKVFIYGAADEANAAAVANIKARFPGLGEVAGQHGYNQSEAGEAAVIAKLRGEKFNLLIVARPSPDKEKFLARCCREAGVVGLAAGGYVDILAGTKKRAPKLVQAIGMEWLYRLAQDPRNLWKRIGWANTRFAASVLWNWTLGVPRRPWFAQPLLHVVALVAIICLAYARSLNAPYHFDDPEYIQRNTAIRSLSSVNQITVTGRRKLWWYSNALCYKLSELLGAQKQRMSGHLDHWYQKLYYKVVLENFGDHQPNRPDVRIFRAWNIACHFVAVLALYGLLRRCLRARARFADGGEPGPDLRPFAAAAIFAAHPLATEAVTYISGRDNGQGGMFYLLGLYFAAMAFDQLGIAAQTLTPNPSHPSHLGGEGNRWPRWFWPAAFTAMSFGAAMATKESHISFPLAVALIFFTFYRRGPVPDLSVGMLCGMLAAIAAIGWGAAGSRDGYLWASVQLALCCLIGGGILGRRETPPLIPLAPLTRGAGGTMRAIFQTRIGTLWAMLALVVALSVTVLLAFPYANALISGALTGTRGNSYARSLCSQAHALPLMLARTVFPISVTFSPDFNITHSLNIDHEFPTIADPHDPRVLIGAAILFALLLFGLFGAWRGWLGAFGVLLALIAIAPTNSIFERGDIASERNFYLTAAGGACLLAWLAGELARMLVGVSGTPASSRLEAGAPFGAPSPLVEKGMWTLIFSFCIVGPFTAFTIVRNHDWGDPYRLWKSAMERSPDKMRVLYNFGESAKAAKRYDEAETAFTRAIAIGEELSKRGAFRPDEAVDVKCFHLAYARLADVFLLRYIKKNKDDARALKSIKKIYEDGLNRTAFDPDLAFTYAEFLIHIDQGSEAIPMLQRSFNLHTWADQLYVPWGVGELEAALYKSAAEHFQLALKMKDEHSLGFGREIDPDYKAQIYALLGVSRLHLKQRAEAHEALKEAMRIYPEAVLPVLTFAAARNVFLPRQNTGDEFLNTLSVVRRDLLRELRDCVNELLDHPSPSDPPNLIEFKKVFDSELTRYEDWRKHRAEFGFKDDPEESEK